MSNQVVPYELSDAELESVTGGGNSPAAPTIVINNQYNIVYAPVYIVNSNVANANIDNGNTYTQNNGGGSSYNIAGHAYVV